MLLTNVTNINGSTFVSFNNSLTVYFNETIFIYNTISSGNFIKGKALKIIFNKCKIQKNIFSASNSNRFIFFDLTSDLFFINSLISENVIKNGVLITSRPFSSSICLVESTIFEKNIGFMTNASLIFVSGNHLIFKMQNVSFLLNQAFLSLVSVSKTLESVFIQKVVFHSNSNQIAALQVELAKDVVLQSIQCFQNITLPFIISENKGSCLILREVFNFNIQDLDISNIWVLDNIAGVIIFQSTFIQEEMQSDLCNFFSIFLF